MTHPEQLAEYLRSIVGTFLHENVEVPEGTLLTVTRVDARPGQRDAIVWISILPEEQAEDVFRRVLRHLYDLQGTVNTQLRSRTAPRLHLRREPGMNDTGANHTLLP